MRAAIAIAALLLSTAVTSAHDDGRFADSPLKGWFDQLASGKGLCCSFADGLAIKDVDWDTATVADAQGRPQVVYRVRLLGRWVPVPPDAVVTEPNRFGPAVVWPVLGFDADGNRVVSFIRCFLPGSMS